MEDFNNSIFGIKTNYTNYTNYTDDTEEYYNNYKPNYIIILSPCMCGFGCLFCIFFCNYVKSCIENNVNYIINRRKRNKNKEKKIKLKNDKNMDLNNDCCICLEKLNELDLEKGNNIILKTVCNHTFHKKCIKHNSIQNCPLCREPLKFKTYCLVKKNTGDSIV